MIIFFDWADESGQDGLSDHTGIVQKVENGRVYTVEGRTGLGTVLIPVSSGALASFRGALTSAGISTLA